MKGAALAALALVACTSPSGSLPSPSPAASSASPSPGASAPSPSVGASAAPLAPKKLARKATPRARRASDDEACTRGEAEACRRMADRYRGYGAVAGCGVDRARERPFLKRATEDSTIDEERFEHYVRRACELGDVEACSIAKRAPSTYAMPTDVARRRAARSRPDEVGVARYRAKKSPDKAKVLEKLRDTCVETGASCWDADLVIFKRDAPKPGAKVEPLGADELALVSTLCKETHDCGEMAMMLDKAGHTPDELAPVRASFGETLTAACVEGECTCGQAARYLPEGDEARLDLAILGCDDGEAEGCFELGRQFEEGKLVVKDVERARALYELACPPTRPLELGPGPRLGEYSPRACDRLAEIVGGGSYPPKPFALAMYYAQFACIHPGYEIEQAPCVRLGRYWAENPIATGHAISDARDAAEGPLRASESENECKRPSVKAECEAFEKAMLTVR